jgi:hypothetical protein
MIKGLKSVVKGKKRHFFFYGVLFCIPLFFATCHKAAPGTQGNIPYVTVDFTINIDVPTYQALNEYGGWDTIPNVGVRGILIVRDFYGNYYAFDRACPYNVAATCSKVSVKKLGDSIQCGQYSPVKPYNWIPCCNSVYSLEGTRISGPTLYGLKQYTVDITNLPLLRVTN